MFAQCTVPERGRGKKEWQRFFKQVMKVSLAFLYAAGTARPEPCQSLDTHKGENMSEKLALYGFNNLTKSLSFNIYDVCYAKSQREQKDYIAYIDQQYNSERLTKLLVDVTNMIGATVLNISSQDYEPQGSSVTILIADESKVPVGDTTVAHLDKSHITVHTYPEYHPDTCLATFRVDIDVATCGEITPLSTLDHLIGSFDPVIHGDDIGVKGADKVV